MVRVGEEDGDDGSGTLGGQGSEHRLECNEANPTVATAQAERHGLKGKRHRGACGGNDFFSEIRCNEDRIGEGIFRLRERRRMREKRCGRHN